MANAPFKLFNGRQYVLSADTVFSAAQVQDTGVPVVAFKLPVNGEVIGGAITVVTPWDTGTSAVIDVGDAAVNNRYLNDANLKVAGYYPIVPTGLVSDGSDVTLTVAAVGAAATVGSARLRIDYIILNKANEVQPN